MYLVIIYFIFFVIIKFGRYAFFSLVCQIYFHFTLTQSSVFVLGTTPPKSIHLIVSHLKSGMNEWNTMNTEEMCWSAWVSLYCFCIFPPPVKQSMDSSDLSDGPITLQEYLEVKKALASSEAKVQQLMKVNNNLSEELRRLQKEVGSGKEPWMSSAFQNRRKLRTINISWVWIGMLDM